MVIIQFEDSETEKRALDFLVGRYSFKTWANGDLMLPEAALGQLAVEGIPFRAKGRATYEQSSRTYSKTAFNRSTSG